MLQYQEAQELTNMKFELLFNESEHMYMDVYGNLYTSVTTAIGKFQPVFDKVAVAKGSSRKRASKYYGWAVKDILNDWDRITKESHVKGNRTHNHLEDITKKSTNFKHDEKCSIKNYVKLYTVDDIINKSRTGELNVDIFLSTGIREKYPRIYNLFIALKEMGFSFYSEIGVYSLQFIISGLIDILCVNHKTKEFIIVDWKTNKHTMMPKGIEENKYLSGYFKKDSLGNETNEFIYTNKYYAYPLDKFQDSHFITYALQLSAYASLFETKGYKLTQIILCHVRDELKFTSDDKICEKYPDYVGLSKVELYNMPYLKEEITKAFTYHANGMSNQSNLFV